MERQFQLNWSAIVEEAKQRRKAQKLTQQKLAMLANVSTPTVSRFENGAKDIQLSSILTILKMLGMLDQRDLIFNDPDNIQYDVSKGIVIFWGQDGEKAVCCAISKEALNDNFQSKSKEPIKIFLQHRSTIEHEAVRKYLANKLEADGSVILKTADFI